jgi:hypothetical protein
MNGSIGVNDNKWFALFFSQPGVEEVNVRHPEPCARSRKNNSHLAVREPGIGATALARGRVRLRLESARESTGERDRF